MIAATSLATHYIIQREHFRLTTIEVANGAEFITGDQPVVNVYADPGPGFKPPTRIRLYYPLSPLRALLVGDDRDDPMTEIEIADASAASRYNALIAGAAQNELYGTSESILRSARGPEKQ